MKVKSKEEEKREIYMTLVVLCNLWLGYLITRNITDDKIHNSINISVTTTINILLRMMIIAHGATIWPRLMDCKPFFKGWKYDIII